MIASGAWLVVALLFAPTSALAGEASPSSKASAPNLSVDSAPGWTPSPDQIQQVQTTVHDYLAAMDEGRYSDAYAYLANSEQQPQPFSEYASVLEKFNTMAGPVKDRRIVKITWTKDPAQAPRPGVYAAIDLVSRFANIDRHCGYLVLYQPPPGGDFKVARDEESYLDNDTAGAMEREHSRADVDLAWAKLTAKCPNYPGAATAAAPAPPLVEQPNSTVGYPTVAAALKALQAQPGVTISNRQGWTIIEDKAALTIWSFSPPQDPAYPAVVKREIVKTGEAASLRTNVLCEASKAACDNLVREFEQLNQTAAQSLRPQP
ncbi:MAG: DUF4019 domain-containing protein [Caulobacterales bacterium]